MLVNIGEDVVLCGSSGCGWYDFSTPGNIHFGYVAYFANVPRDPAAIAGGLAQFYSELHELGLDCIGSVWQNYRERMDPSSLWGDDPRDQAGVDLGYRLARDYGDDVSEAELKQALSGSVATSLQRSIFPPSRPAVPQPNIYGPDYFNWP